MNTARKASFLNTGLSMWDIMVTDYAAAEKSDSFKKVGHIEDLSNGNGLQFRIAIDGQDPAYVTSFRVGQFYAVGVIECDNLLA